MGELRSASVTLAEILAFIKQTRQTGRLVIRAAAPTAPADPARLTFSDGHLVDARWGDASGDDPVYRLLGTREATFAFDRPAPDAVPAERSISRGQELLLLGAIGVVAEEDASAAAAHPANGAPPAAVPPAPPELRRPRAFKRRNMIPLPTGQPSYSGVALPRDFSELLDWLERDRFSGQVTWFSATAEGMLLLYDGQVIDAHWAGGEIPAASAEQARLRHGAAMGGSPVARHVEVYALDPEFVWSYSSLAYGHDHPHEQGMHGVDLRALLAELQRTARTGCVKVVADNQAAYLFLCQGRILGEFRALPAALEPAPGRAMALTRLPGSLVDVYTAPQPAELATLNPNSWPVARVARELQGMAQAVLGAKAGQIQSVLGAAGDDPAALRAAATRARQITRVFVGAAEFAELGRRMDRLLDHLP